MSLSAGTRLGPYEIQSSIGAGGMGEVYRARDTRLDRVVAIKVLSPQLAANPQFRERFDREARTVSRLNHSHICTIHDVGHDSGTSYLVMEYVEGETLGRWLRRTPRPSVETIVDTGLQIARALVAAHTAGIVHRDIKPENVIVKGDGVVKVLDFGIAKLVDVPAMDAMTVAGTVAGFVVGTTKYMSPEQARGISVDARSDIFSFGVLLYEMLSGQAPFEGATATDTVMAILQREPAPITQHRPESGSELQRIVSKCLEKDAGRRYASARDLVVDLERCRAGTQAGAAKPSGSIAVLPFVSMSADPENEYFCDGLAEDLINVLTKIGQLQVAARTSAFSFKGKNADLKEVGRTLNVGTVLEGSVRKVGSRLRVTAQLVNVADGYQLWSERYDRQLEDVFEIQDEISMAIVKALKVKLLGGEQAALAKRHTENVEAFQLYLQGRHHWHKWSVEGLAKSKECMERAIAIDPDYAVAYVGLADTSLAAGAAGLLSYAELLPKAKGELTRALALDPHLDEAWTLLSVVHFFEWEWPAAERAVARALELNPRLGHAHQVLALVELFQGRYDSALAPAKRSLELDPLAPLGNYGLVLVHIARGDHRSAWDRVRAGLDFDPSFWMVHYARGMLMTADGDHAQAVHAMEEAVRCSGGVPSAVGAMICAIGLAGQRDRAEQELAALFDRAQHGHVPALSIALAYVGLGDTGRAFEWLERSYAERDVWLRCAWSNPLFAGVRGDPRMTDLLRRMGLQS